MKKANFKNTTALNKPESGRSMVEMLGVLAVIGVLSVGGIAGYTTAMRKHRANEVAYQLNMMAHECSRFYTLQGQTGPCETDGLGLGEVDGLQIESTIASAGTQFRATVSGMSEELCNAVKARLEDWAIANPQGECVEGAANSLDVQFKNDLAAWADGDAVNTPSTGSGEGEGETPAICDPACGNNQYCDNGTCTDCPAFVENPCKETAEDENGCPVAGTAKTDGNSCSVNGLTGTCQGGECTPTCPDTFDFDGGDDYKSPGIWKSTEGICCGYLGYSYNSETKTYDIPNATICGCLGFGEVNGLYCCSGVQYTLPEYNDQPSDPEKCGCSEGYELNSDGRCCDSSGRTDPIYWDASGFDSQLSAIVESCCSSQPPGGYLNFGRYGVCCTGGGVISEQRAANGISDWSAIYQECSTLRGM